MSVYKHHGKWRYEFMIKKVRHRKAGFETKLDAQMAEIQARKNLNRTNLDFIRLCESRLRDVQNYRTERYFKDYEKFIKNRVREWAHLEITRELIQLYLNEVAKRSAWMANKELKYFRALFNHGIENDLCSENPALRVKFFGVKRKPKYIPPYQDIERVLQECTWEQYCYLQAHIHTLCRTRELNNLKWEEVYEDYLILWTRKARNSDWNSREIPLSEQLKFVLGELPRRGKYVFTNPKTGTKYDHRKKMLIGLCKRAGVKRFGFHALRHYGASRLAAKGVPNTDIQKLLGHQNIITTSVYLQSIGSLKEAVNKL